MKSYKKTAAKIATLLMILAGSSASCADKSNNTLTEIPFTEYSLMGTSCQWTNLSSNNAVIVVNNDEELDRYITCTDGNYPIIDFSKNTLLLASGTAAGGISMLSKKILISSNRYTLEIKIILNDAAIAGTGWIVALITNKISTESDIKLNVTTIKN